MGVDTALMVRTKGMEGGLRDHLLVRLGAEEGVCYDPRFGVDAWTFRPESGELLVSSMINLVKVAHSRRHPGRDRILEIVNAKGSK